MTAVDFDCIESCLNGTLCSFTVFFNDSFDLILLERMRSLAASFDGTVDDDTVGTPVRADEADAPAWLI